IPACVPSVFPTPRTHCIADDICSRRGNGTLLDLDGALVQILPTAVLNKAAYQWYVHSHALRCMLTCPWGQHKSVGRAEGGTTPQLKLKVGCFAAQGTCSAADQLKTFRGSLAAAMEFADGIGTSVHVPDNVYNNLAKFLSPQQMVEAVVTTGGYAFVGRFTVALNADEKMNADVPVPA
ncbi:hypothetical protein C8R44DRAFT_611345, partial [Mycena epipterygia]